MRNKYFDHYALLITLIFISGIAKAQQWGDYTLYSTGSSTVLVDTTDAGAVVHTWTHTTKTGYSSYLMPGGILWRTVSKSGNSFSGGPVCGQVQKVAYDGTLLWDFVYSTTAYCTHHDICPMPNGNVLLIAYETKTAAEVTAAGGNNSIVMWPDKIVEVKPTGPTTGEIVWEWHTWDHLVQNVKPNAANYQTSIVNHPELININYKQSKDWQHMNGIDYNPILDQITFSSHNLSEIYVIDHSTTTAEAATHKGGNSGKGGDILYRWGNPLAYEATGSKILNVTHDAHWNPEGTPNAGYLAAYNNGGITSPSTTSCADMVETPVNGYVYNITPGAAYTPASYSLRQPSGGYNSNMGSSQQLPNGNVLICVATAGTINEFSPKGVKLWSKSMGGSCAKAYRYNKCYVENPGPAMPVITASSTTLTATSAATYQWYVNGTLISGATSQTYTPVKSGKYIVRITDSKGCVYEYSNAVNFSVSTDITMNESGSSFNFYPNPTSGIVTIEQSLLNEKNYEVHVFDALGKLMQLNKNASVIDLSAYQNGIYIIQVYNGIHHISSKRISLIK